jgi:hypothetical protein
MDPRRTPEKVLTGHPYDQMSDFAGNPGAPTAPATPGSILPKRSPALTAPAQDRLGLDDDQAVAQLGPPMREQDPKQPIPKAKAGTTSSVAFEHSNLMAQGDRFQQRCGFEGSLRASGSAALVGIPIKAGYRQTFETTNQFARFKF